MGVFYSINWVMLLHSSLKNEPNFTLQLAKLTLYSDPHILSQELEEGQTWLDFGIDFRE
jgi:hypothetical protein